MFGMPWSYGKDGKAAAEACKIRHGKLYCLPSEE
jgi:hypothetical protein